MKRAKLVGAALIASVVTMTAFSGAQAQMRGQGHMMQGGGAQTGQAAQTGQGKKGQMRGQGHMMQGGAQTGQAAQTGQGKKGQMGRMGQGGMMGHMMRQGGMMGRGMKGHAAGFKREKALSNDEVRRVVDGRLALGGLSKLKAGAAKDSGEKAAEVDVVTEKGDMVFRLKVDRKTGRAVIVQ